VQQQVEQAELDLAQGLHSALEILCRDHLVVERARQRRAGVGMGGHAGEHIPLPAEVFHELAGQFDRIPFDAVDAGHRQFIDLGQQVVQAVAAFVEQGDDIVVAEGGGRIFAHPPAPGNCS
jgi:broad specificity phosphatase PhoE